MGKITAWSWSRHADYLQCPRKTKLKHVDRHKEPGSAAMERGSMIHDILAAYLTGKLAALPTTLDYAFNGKTFSEEFPDLRFFMKDLKKLRTAYKRKDHAGMTVEDDWAFTKAWVPTRWDDWTHCWVRMKLDLAHLEKRGKRVVITDWKSGKVRAEDTVAYKQQLQLYAVAGLIKHPKAEEVLPRLVFVDAFTIVEGDLVRRDQLLDLQKEWEKRVKPMFLDTIFAARPTAKCRWCWYGEAKKKDGGPGLCEF